LDLKTNNGSYLVRDPTMLVFSKWYLVHTDNFYVSLLSKIYQSIMVFTLVESFACLLVNHRPRLGQFGPSLFFTLIDYFMDH